MEKCTTRSPLAERPQLPKLVIDWTNVLHLTRQGYVDLLKMSIENSVEEGTAKLIHISSSSLEHDAPPPITLSEPIVQATWEGRTDVVRYLVESFSDIVIEEDESSQPPYYVNIGVLHCCRKSAPRRFWQDIVGHRHGPYIASHIAASRGFVDILRVWESLCVKWEDDLGRTPLHWAAFYGQNKAVKYLLDEGAEISATNIDDVTPVMDCTYQLSCSPNTKDCRPYLETFATLLDNGAVIEDTHIAFCLSVGVQISKQLAEEEFGCLVSLVTRVGEDGMVFIARLFGMYTAGQDGITSGNFRRFYVGFLYFMSFASHELDQVSTLWECALKFEPEQSAVESRPLSPYGNRKAITSWVEAEAVISEAQRTGDATEVVYHSAIMLERSLGPHNPFVFKALFNLPLALDTAYSQSVVMRDLFLHSLERFSTHLVKSNVKDVDVELFLPFELFREGTLPVTVSDIKPLLEMLVNTLEQVNREAYARVPAHLEETRIEQLSDWNGFFSAIALSMLFCAVCLSNDEVSHEIDELGVRLMSVVGPRLAFDCMMKYTSRLTAANKIENSSLVTKSVLLWIDRSGSLYVLDRGGRGIFSVGQLKKIHDFIAEIGLHHDAVDERNRTVYFSIYQDMIEKLLAVCDSPSVPLLTCLTSRAIVRHRIPYRAAGCLPPQVVKFVSLHDPKRPRHILINHNVRINPEFESITFKVPLFSST